MGLPVTSANRKKKKNLDTWLGMEDENEKESLFTIQSCLLKHFHTIIFSL